MARLIDREKQRDVSQSVVFDVLNHERRRYALASLFEENPTTLDELAEQIAVIENDVSVGQLTDQQRKRVYTSLRQFHLPKLEDAGLVEYDPDDRDIRLTESAKTAEYYLNARPETDRSWLRTVLALVVAFDLLVVVSASGLWPVALATPGQWALLGFGAVTAVAAGYLYALTRETRSDVVQPSKTDDGD